MTTPTATTVQPAMKGPTPPMTRPHVPTPYFAEGLDIYAIHPNGHRYQIAKAYTGWLASPLSATITAKQQAAFIVKACNFHGPLVECIQALTDNATACDNDPSLIAEASGLLQQVAHAYVIRNGGAQ